MQDRKRYKLKTDQDSHWYLVPVEREAEFESLCEDAYAKDEYETFCQAFDGLRISGPYSLTFVDPVLD